MIRAAIPSPSAAGNEAPRKARVSGGRAPSPGAQGLLEAPARVILFKL